MALYDRDATNVKDDVNKYLINQPPTGDNASHAQNEFILRQLWTLVKMMRTCRRSLRSNAAFYSYLKQVFPWADFRDVPKDNEFGKGLQITILVNGQKYSDDSLDNGNGGDTMKEDGQQPAGDGEGL